MSNHLTTDKKTVAVSMLCEGNSIRSIERMTGVHRDTIMRLGVRMGEGCQKIMHEKFFALWTAKLSSYAPAVLLTGLCGWFCLWS